LPASGCAMMANVRLRAMAAGSSPGSGMTAHLTGTIVALQVRSVAWDTRNVRWFLALVLLGGCDLVFELPDPVTDDAGCRQPESLFATFDNPADPCAGLGITVTGDSLAEAVQSQLRVTPLPNIMTTTVGGCLSFITQPFDTGVFLEVSQPISGAAEYMEFRAYWDDGVRNSRLKIGGAGLIFLQNDVVIGETELPASARWWRMRGQGDRVVAETSPDGNTWTVFATDPTPAPERVKVELAIGSFAAEQSPSTTIVDGINVCP
jgi:hypothetical protein